MADPHVKTPDDPLRSLDVKIAISTALVVILAAACALVWRQLGDETDGVPAAAESTPATSPAATSPAGTSTGSDSCPRAEAPVRIAADPGVAPALKTLAERYGALPVGDRTDCSRIRIDAVEARAMLDDLTAPDRDPGAHGEHPAAWIPESSIWFAALSRSRSRHRARPVDGEPVSLVRSPVVLAVRPELAVAAHGDMNWFHVPSVTYAAAFQAYGHSDVLGSIRLAMPNRPRSDATALAAQAYAHQAYGRPGGLTLDAVRAPNIDVGLRQLVHAPPRAGDGGAVAAVRAMAEAADFSSSRIRSVPISEQRLFQITSGDRRARVSIIRPRGATPVLDYPVIDLAGSDPRAAAAVNAFLAFVKKPAQQKVFSAAGFRSAGPLPDATATVDFPELRDVMPTAEPAAAVAVSEIVLPSAAPRRSKG
ncbi:MAG: substrate-binding domain-containing protein [Gordonia sp. (in: high G+C Gram-positive bacteria)]|uniref:substrate-binding domain-containing protein n=1 Tax=Gordonia sp. (in: high G+C Gram-positive bacteria) TaxID=84139 RepID=UPI0039E5F939